MRIFISWAGDRSRAVATALKEFIPLIFQRAEIFTSFDDISKGTRWYTEITAALARTDVGIICLTPESLSSPWIFFEAGALSKTLTPARVIPLLFGLSVVDVSGPLSQFQACSADKAGIRQLLAILNRDFDPSLPDEIFETLFESMWPSLEGQLQRIALISTPEYRSHGVTFRSDRELLEELLLDVRTIQKKVDALEAKSFAVSHEMEGRMLASMGYVLGEISIRPDSLEVVDPDRLKEAIALLQESYGKLREVGGPAEYMALNNLVFYSSFLEDSSRRDFLLVAARKLLEVGLLHNTKNLLLTACRVLLQFGNTKEKRRARKILGELLQGSLSAKERREVELYLASLPRK